MPIKGFWNSLARHRQGQAKVDPHNKTQGEMRDESMPHWITTNHHSYSNRIKILRILGTFRSRTPATTSELKEIAYGASSGGGKHVDVGEPKALEYSSMLKRDKRWWRPAKKVRFCGDVYEMGGGILWLRGWNLSWYLIQNVCDCCFGSAFPCSYEVGGAGCMVDNQTVTWRQEYSPGFYQVLAGWNPGLITILFLLFICFK